MAVGYIYLIINKVNGKTYIGQKKLYSKSWDKDGYMGSGKHLKCAQNKYGIENFEKFLIQYCDSKDELNKAEIFWIAEYRKRGKAEYNITNGGQSGSGPCSEETKRKLSLLHKGQIPWNKGKKTEERTLETRNKISQSEKGKHISDEMKKLLSKKISGRHWKIVDGKRIWYEEGQQQWQ